MFPSLHNKYFKSLANTNNGEVGAETLFHYRQEDDIIWATYRGGDIKFGTLSGKRIDNQLIFTYQHLNHQDEFMTGKCTSIIRQVNDEIQLHEQWEWTCKDFSKGESILEEIL